MAVALGARRGELVGLRWTAVDLDAGVVRIESSVANDDLAGTDHRVTGQMTVKDTKSHSARTVALDGGTVAALRAMRARHVEAALACGIPYPADAFVWRDDPGGTRPRPPDRFTYDWTQVDKAVGDGGHVRFHDLRDYHGTMLVGSGVPIASVRDRLGHSSLTVTNIYVDGRPEWDRKSADIIGAVLDQTPDRRNA